MQYGIIAALKFHWAILYFQSMNIITLWRKMCVAIAVRSWGHLVVLYSILGYTLGKNHFSVKSVEGSLTQRETWRIIWLCICWDA